MSDETEEPVTAEDKAPETVDDVARIAFTAAAHCVVAFLGPAAAPDALSVVYNDLLARAKAAKP
jgi:hypothetical protein